MKSAPFASLLTATAMAVIPVAQAVAGGEDAVKPPPMESTAQTLLRAEGYMLVPLGQVHGMESFLGVKEGQLHVFHITPDGLAWFDAEMRDGSGRNPATDAVVKALMAETTVRQAFASATPQALDALSSPAPSPAPAPPPVWQKLEQAAWFSVGNSGTDELVYMFVDPDCGPCAHAWKRLKPQVDAGRLQVRLIAVGEIMETSRGKAAALLTDADPAVAWEWNISRFDAKTGGGLRPLTEIPDEIAATLEENSRLMRELGARAIPFTLRLRDGDVERTSGIPDDLVKGAS